MTHHVLEGHIDYRHRQRRAPGEVRLHGLARHVHLAEEHSPGRPFLRSPLLEASLQCSQVTLLVAGRVLRDQVLEDDLCLELRCVFQHLPDPRPVRFERIGPCTPAALYRQLAWQLPAFDVLARRLPIHRRDATRTSDCSVFCILFH